MPTPDDATPLRLRGGLLALVFVTTACFAPVGKDSSATGTDASSSGGASNVSSTSEPGETTTTSVTPTGEPTTTTVAATGTSTVGPTTDGTTTSTADPTTEPATTDTTELTDPMTSTGSSSTTETDKLCGNGVLDGMEGCDNGAENANNAPCTKLCQLNVCGDGLPCVPCMHDCDDGNLVNGDGCSDQCKSEVRYIFVTKSTFTGKELGGILGADAKCMQAASAAADISPLLKGRKFRAWLSTTLIDAKSHVGDDMKPVLRTDDAQVAINTPGLYSGGKLQVAIDRNEYGEQVAAPSLCLDKTNLVWTGTLADGTRDDDVCANWSGAGASGLMGNFSANDASWTDCDVFACGTAGHLYCLEIP